MKKAVNSDSFQIKVFSMKPGDGNGLPNDYFAILLFVKINSKWQRESKGPKISTLTNRQRDFLIFNRRIFLGIFYLAVWADILETEKEKTIDFLETT